jgi:hypothetical protein
VRGLDSSLTQPPPCGFPVLLAEKRLPVRSEDCPLDRQLGTACGDESFEPSLDVTEGRVATTIITWCAGAAERSRTSTASRASDLPGSGGRRRLPGRRGRCHVLGDCARSAVRRPTNRAGTLTGSTATLSTSRWRRTMPGSFGLRTSRPAGAGRPGRPDQARSNRSRFITLSQAAAKSFTNFSFASSLA